ncbi:MAG: hypothetical protein ULS35scaffold63_34 [Phage 33_17]|nr:MAG: hypothetical protein ULS35scaffold63_34 [Phage 33_17]
MSDPIPITLALNSYKASSKSGSDERLLNMYLEPLPPESAFKAVLYGSCGLTLVENLDQFDPVWGMQIMGANLYIICGVTVYKIDTALNVTNLGDLPTIAGRVMLTDNGSQLTILTASGRSFYTDGTVLEEITSPDYKLSSSVDTSDGYTIFSKQNSNEFFISGINNTTIYNSLDYTLVQSQSDNIVRIFANQGQLWIFKQYTTEIYYDSGNPFFPFQQINGANIQRGCSAKFSISSDDTGIYWLGDDRSVYVAQGYEAQKISTYAIDTAIRQYTVISDAFSFIYTDNGHKFLALTFPTEGVTWEYDLLTNLWHERQSYNTTRWRANCSVFFAGRYLIGDYQEGIIYEIDSTNYTENGDPIFREIISTNQYLQSNRFTLDRFLIKMDTGIGLTSGEGSNPQIMLQISTDGGYTWSNEMWQPLGKIGNYQTEIVWYRLGWGREFTFKLRISAAVKVAILEAYINVTNGIS